LPAEIEAIKKEIKLKTIQAIDELLKAANNTNNNLQLLDRASRDINEVALNGISQLSSVINENLLNVLQHVFGEPINAESNIKVIINDATEIYDKSQRAFTQLAADALNVISN